MDLSINKTASSQRGLGLGEVLPTTSPSLTSGSGASAPASPSLSTFWTSYASSLEHLYRLERVELQRYFDQGKARLLLKYTCLKHFIVAVRRLVAMNPAFASRVPGSYNHSAASLFLPQTQPTLATASAFTGSPTPTPIPTASGSPPPWLPQLRPPRSSSSSTGSRHKSASPSMIMPSSLSSLPLASSTSPPPLMSIARPPPPPLSSRLPPSPRLASSFEAARGQQRLHRCHHSDCNYATDRRSNLKRHVLAMHERALTKSNHLCCGIHFENKAKQRLHARSVHR